MRIPLIVLIAAVVCVAPGAATPAWAQGGSTQKPPAQTTKPKPTPKLPIGFRFFGAFDGMAMAATDTFEAHTGSPIVPGYGVGGEVLNIWKRIFVRVGYSTGSVDGTRGFVIDGDFVSNGVPLKLGVQNTELSVGWRSYLKGSAVAWYVAGGLNMGTNSQETPDADSADNNSKSANGFVGTMGLEFAVPPKAKYPVVFGIEAAYRSVGGVLGETGTSEAFGESDFGGFAIRGLVGIRFKK